MKVLLQRVKKAQVSVEAGQRASISKGLLLFVGISKDDSENDSDYLSGKVAGLRIFDDEAGKMNLDVRQIAGEILSVPQFTLFADTASGNRPGFEAAAEPVKARRMWEEFNSKLMRLGLIVKTGMFGAGMQVELVNDGPVTLMLDSKDKA